MSDGWRKGAILGIVVVGALLLTTFGTGVSSATTTYSVNLKELGLPTGTSWSATFNGVTNTGTGTSQVFTGLAAGSYCWYYEDPVAGAATTTRYVPYTYSGCLTVPDQLTVADSYTQQVTVNFAVTPTGAGTLGPGTGWYTVGSTVAIQASETFGYTFSKWTVGPTTALTLLNTTWESSAVTVLATGTVTGHFLVNASQVVFDEAGLPAGTSWSVDFGGSTRSSTGATISTGFHNPGAYSWSIASVGLPHGVLYVPSPASGGINVPYQPTQQIVFVKEFSVTTAVSPASTGTVSPSANVYDFANNSNLAATAFDGSSYVFTTWSASVGSNIGIESKTTAGTNVTIQGSGTLTAHFVSGTPCTTCTVTFYQVGLPAGTGWGVTFNSVQYSTTASKIVLSGLTAAASWTAFSPVASAHFGEQYIPNVYTSSGYWSVGSTTSYTIVYEPEYYLTVVENPYNSGSATIGTGWYVRGAQIPVSAINTETTHFVSWSSSSTNLTFPNAALSSVPLTLKGPATLTANFAQLTSTVHFVEFGLPGGTTWGVNLDSTWFWGATKWINVSGVPDAYYGWGAGSTISGGTGIQWDVSSASTSVQPPVETVQAVVYVEEYQVTFVAGGTAGGTISPSGSAWFPVGTVLPIMAENGTSATFGSWSKTVTTGTITLSSTTAASTYATIKGAGTVTATFT